MSCTMPILMQNLIICHIENIFLCPHDVLISKSKSLYPRLGSVFCLASSGQKLFAKVIKGIQNSLLAGHVSILWMQSKVCIVFIKICDVIWENLTYEGTNCVFVDEPFPYVYIHRLFLNCAEREKTVFRRCSFVTKNQSLIRCCTERATPDQSLFLLFLHSPGVPRRNHI